MLRHALGNGIWVLEKKFLIGMGFDFYFGIPIVNSHPPFVYVENHHVTGYDPKDKFVLDTKAETKEIMQTLDDQKIADNTLLIFPKAAMPFSNIRRLRII